MDDAVDEPDGSVTAALRKETGYTVSASRGTAKVAVADDDEFRPSILTHDGRAMEGTDTTMSFNVVLTPTPQQTVTVDWATSGGG